MDDVPEESANITLPSDIWNEIRCKLDEDNTVLTTHMLGLVNKSFRELIKSKKVAKVGSDKLVDIIAKLGYVNLLQFAHQNNFVFGINSLLLAICHSHMDCVKFIVENDLYQYGDIVWVSNIAAMHGQLEILKYLHDTPFGQ